MIHEVVVLNKKRTEMLDITSRIREIIKRENIEEGIAVIFSAHTTAGITINENADPDVQTDFLRRLEEIFPWDMAADRHEEGNSAAHLKASIVGPQQTVIIKDGDLLLGTWQGIYFCEFDGPRRRKCYVKII
ncbi:MAG: YjbQ family protein [Peptococcaceae bacterium]|nr:YjbQ family protein [Peptococcaceae bacterium]